MKLISALLCSACLAAAACGQGDKPAAAAQDPQQVLRDVQQQLQKEGIVLDAKAQTVAIPAVVNQPQDPIEYVLIHRRGKRHEALFWTKCKPSVLNAALLMLGLVPGQNAKAEEIQPPPSLDEIEKGAETVKVTPPQGMNFWVTVRWTTPEGKAVEHCIEDLILDLGTQQPVVDCSFVFLGGRMAQIYKNEPEVFVADFEGNLISACYMYPENHLGTFVHERARDQQNWWMTNQLPEPDTEVQFVFHRQPGPLHKARAERLAKAKAAADKPAETPPKPKSDGK